MQVPSLPSPVRRVLVGLAALERARRAFTAFVATLPRALAALQLTSPRGDE